MSTHDPGNWVIQFGRKRSTSAEIGDPLRPKQVIHFRRNRRSTSSEIRTLIALRRPPTDPAMEFSTSVAISNTSVSGLARRRPDPADQVVRARQHGPPVHAAQPARTGSCPTCWSRFAGWAQGGHRRLDRQAASPRRDRLWRRHLALPVRRRRSVRPGRRLAPTRRRSAPPSRSASSATRQAETMTVDYATSDGFGPRRFTATRATYVRVPSTPACPLLAPVFRRPARGPCTRRIAVPVPVVRGCRAFCGGRRPGPTRAPPHGAPGSA